MSVARAGSRLTGSAGRATTSRSAPGAAGAGPRPQAPASTNATMMA
jgi:hypothetical protein